MGGAEDFLDSLYGSSASVNPVVKKKRFNDPSQSSRHPVASFAPSAVPLHPLLVPLSTRGPQVEQSLQLMGIQNPALDRIVPLDNFAAGKMKRNTRTRPVCPKAARFVEIPDPSTATNLHELWLEYMTHARARDDEPELLGARVEVVASENAANVGISGIIVKDGVNALSIFSDKRKKVLLVPRDVCRFRIAHGDRTWMLDRRKSRLAC